VCVLPVGEWVSSFLTVHQHSLGYSVPGLAWYISPIYIIDIYRIYIQYFRSKIWDILDIVDVYDFYRVFKRNLIWYIVTMFWFSVRVFCWLMTCALRIFSVLDNFCHISPLYSNAVWITRVLHLYAMHTHTHILLFGSKFHIIFAVYVQMLHIYIEKNRKYQEKK